MFEIGWTELLVIAVVAIIVIGPKELPRLMRTFGHYTGKLRRAAADFQRQFEEAARDTELDELRQTMHEFRQHARFDMPESPAGRPLMTRQPSPPSDTRVGSPDETAAKRSPARKPRQGSAAAQKPSSRRKKTPAAKARRNTARKEETT